jgi:hypothetical protein
MFARPLNRWRACGGFCCAHQETSALPEEQFLDMEGVRGSIPLPPTIYIKMLA